MKVPNSWAIFPLYPILPDGRCGCGTDGCANAGKHPAYKWGELGPGDKAPIPEGFGIGIATGARSGVVGIDLDFKPNDGINGLESLIALAGPAGIPDTLMVATPSGGFHLYFKAPGFKVKNSASELGEGIDVRGDGGYLVLPPSPHKRGGVYEFLNIPEGFDGDLADLCAPLPEWIGARVTAGTPGAFGAPFPVPALPSTELGENQSSEDGWKVIDRAVNALKKCEPGRRNQTLFRIAAELGDWSFVGDVSLDDARHAILTALATYGWENPDKCKDTLERGFAKGRAKERLLVVVGPDHQECNEQAIQALGTRDDVYVIGNRLARDSGGNGIVTMTRSNLQEILSRCVDWRSRSKEGELKRVHPPEWTTQEVYDRGWWDGIRVVEGFSDVPILRPDGSVANAAGYDGATRVVMSRAVPEIPMSPLEASELLRDVVCDFPFASDSHLASWVCSVLTPLALYAFSGPVPLFLFEASTAGSGKSLLVSASGLISTGNIPSLMTFRDEEAEMRKTITSHAQRPKPLVFLDNVTGELGGAALCAVLTSPDRVWSDRLLGGNNTFSGKLNTVWYATANNTKLGPDMERRVCPIRLTPTQVRPELREGFRHSRLLDYVRTNLDVLTWACLTILQGYIRAGHPMRGRVRTWGSFEGWADLVVGACAWAGFGTPDNAVNELRESGADALAEGAEFVAGWRELETKQQTAGMTAQEAFDACYPQGPGMGGPFARCAEGAERLRHFLDGRFPKGATARVLGYLLRDYRDRPFETGILRQGRLKDGYRRWSVT